MTDHSETDNMMDTDQAKTSESTEGQVNQNDSKQQQEESPNGDDSQKKLEEMKDQLLRTMAEFENYKKRSEREISDMAKYSVTNFAKDMLIVSDNFNRALDAIPAQENQDNPLIKSLAEGIKMTENELAKAFKKHGIEKIDPLDKPFDHNYHQAIMEVDVEGTESGSVVEVLQSGYKIHDRLLRPAMVKVAK